MSFLAPLFRHLTPQKAATPMTPASHAISCPACGKTAGFLLEMDGVSYRVLEDDHDTELIHEAGRDAVVTCEACKVTLTSIDALALSRETGHAVSLKTGAPTRMGPRRNRVHRAGKAAIRVAPDGRQLPMCPECGALHDFLVELDGIAHMVLEDDHDTELLAGAPDLLCSRCNAVFDL